MNSSSSSSSLPRRFLNISINEQGLALVCRDTNTPYSYFSSKFHIFDSVIILAAFVIDVTLHGTDEELGSLVVILRLWRVFKIIEELSSAGQDSLEKYEEEIEQLRAENRDLRHRLNASSSDGNAAGDGSDDRDAEGNAS